MCLALVSPGGSAVELVPRETGEAVSALLATLLLGAAARVESVQLGDVGLRTFVRVAWSGTPALVSVQRAGGVTRVVLKDAELGLPYAGGTRYAWTSASAPAPVSEAPLHGLDIESRTGAGGCRTGTAGTWGGGAVAVMVVASSLVRLG